MWTLVYILQMRGSTLGTYLKQKAGETQASHGGRLRLRFAPATDSDTVDDELTHYVSKCQPPTDDSWYLVAAREKANASVPQVVSLRTAADAQFAPTEQTAVAEVVDMPPPPVVPVHDMRTIDLRDIMAGGELPVLDMKDWALRDNRTDKYIRRLMMEQRGKGVTDQMISKLPSHVDELKCKSILTICGTNVPQGFARLKSPTASCGWNGRST